MRLPRSLEPLRDRNLARYTLATGISTFGGGMAEVALAFAVLDLGGATDLGLVLFAREIPLVVLVLAGGVWADRLPRKLILAGSDALRCASQGATAALLLTGGASVWSIAALQVVFGGAVAFSRPATTGLVQQLSSPERLQEANAIVGLSRSTMRIVGPAVGAILVTTVGPAWALAGDAATFACSALVMVSLRLPPPVVARIRQSALADLRDGWREVRSRTWLWTMIAYFGLWQMMMFPALFVLGPLVAKEELGGAGAWGTILAFQAIGAVVGGVAALRLRFARPLVASIGLAMLLPWLLYLLAVPAPLAVIAGFALLASACLSVDDVVWTSAVQRHIPEHAISRVSSFDWLGSVALNPVGYLLVGPISGAIGVSETLVLAATLNTAAAAVVVLSVPAVRALRSYPAGLGSSR